MTKESSSTTKPSARSAEIDGNVEIPIVWYHDWVKEHIILDDNNHKYNNHNHNNKVAIVTGSNSGTGFWCAKALIQTGATVILACRNLEKANAAKEEILQETNYNKDKDMQDIANNNKLVVLKLDTSQLASVRAFATAFQERFQRLDWLVNNAGVMALNYSTTQDGHEIQWQTNHLGHFLLTKLLWKTIMATPGETRIIQHSSSMHSIGAPKFDSNSMEFPKHGLWAWPLWNIVMPLAQMPKHNWARYGVSKLSNVLFMKGLEERINQFEIMKANSGGDDEKKVLSIACHPGYAKTQLQLVAASEGGSMGVRPVGTNDGAQSAADGSLPLLMACLSKEVENGDYLGPSEKYTHMKGVPNKQQVGGFGKDPDQIESLWKYSEECIGEKFDLTI